VTGVTGNLVVWKETVHFGLFVTVTGMTLHYHSTTVQRHYLYTYYYVPFIIGCW
jgi:hypothetical protein